jgi:hypothetical protein
MDSGYYYRMENAMPSAMFRLLPLVSGVVALCLATSSAQAAIVKEGVPGNEVKLCVEDFQANGYMPIYVKGYASGGRTYYDLAFEPQEPGLRWQVYYRLSEADWRQKSSDYADLGWLRPCSNHFFDNGRRYHATLFVKRDN